MQFITQWVLVVSIGAGWSSGCVIRPGNNGRSAVSPASPSQPTGTQPTRFQIGTPGVVTEPMPDVRGLTLEQAQEVFQRMGATIGSIVRENVRCDVMDRPIEDNTICWQMPIIGGTPRDVIDLRYQLQAPSTLRPPAASESVPVAAPSTTTQPAQPVTLPSKSPAPPAKPTKDSKGKPSDAAAAAKKETYF
jgi:hypothetical protein